MALFGTPNSFVGLDLGTSSLKVVELVNKRKAVEVATYGEVAQPNLLLETGSGQTGVATMAQAVQKLLEAAEVASDTVVAALPSSVVFSTVLMLPDLEDKDMTRAVHFAAKEVVPANLDEMVLGWSRVGHEPHMDGLGEIQSSDEPVKKTVSSEEDTVPVFVTAAPTDVVERYQLVMKQANLELLALEVETNALVRSLLEGNSESALLVDLGDKVTTYHVIEQGTARFSHSVDVGGADITAATATALQQDEAAAVAYKMGRGLSQTGAEASVHDAVMEIVSQLIQEGGRLASLHAQTSRRAVKRIILIGGGAKLKGLNQVWSDQSGVPVVVGDPWRGLRYPQSLEDRIKEMGPSFAVAVGLAQRGMRHV